MSAFIVTKQHIDAIVGTIYQRSCTSFKDLLVQYNGSLDMIGQVLWDENFRSVNCRYNESDEAEKYTFSYKSVSLIQAIKAIDCLNYQSCESVDYEKSKSKEIQSILLQVLFNELKYQHPDYESALWGM